MAGEYVIKQGTNIFPLQFKIGTLLLEIFLATCIKDFKNDFFFFCNFTFGIYTKGIIPHEKKIYNMQKDVLQGIYAVANHLNIQ